MDAIFSQSFVSLLFLTFSRPLPHPGPQLGIRALGFSPMRNSEILLHEYNENIKVDVFLEGVEVYIKLIPHLANCEV